MPLGQVTGGGEGGKGGEGGGSGGSGGGGGGLGGGCNGGGGAIKPQAYRNVIEVQSEVETHARDARYRMTTHFMTLSLTGLCELCQCSTVSSVFVTER